MPPLTADQAAEPTADPESPDFGFARAFRVTLPAHYRVSLSRRPILRSGRYSLHLVPHEPQWRLGLVVPRRFVKTAVRRNAVKRAWREAFRQRQPLWARQYLPQDLVVRLISGQEPCPTPEFRRRCAVEAGALLDELESRLSPRIL